MVLLVGVTAALAACGSNEGAPAFDAHPLPAADATKAQPEGGPPSDTGALVEPRDSTVFDSASPGSSGDVPSMKDEAEAVDRPATQDVRGDRGHDGNTPAVRISVAPGASPGTAKVEVILADPSDVISSIAVSAFPDNVTGSAPAASLTIAGLASQSSHTFNVTLTMSSGNVFTATTPPLAFYDVLATFVEPECANNTVFAGSFTFESGNETISNLRGTLTQAMVDGPPVVALAYQLAARSVVLDGMPGQLVATFALDTTDTFAEGGFVPGGSKTYGNHNAYAQIFVNTGNPATAPTANQIDWLAYADCTPNGLMGKSCMTGTSVAAYGRTGTMKAYPIAQVTTQR